MIWKSILPRFLALLSVALMPVQAQAAPLVFIHGIKGSSLVNEQDSTVWIDGWQALGLSTPRLALPLSWDQDGHQARDRLRADGILRKVRVIPFVLEQEVYGEWVEAARSFGVPFHEFAYDWRRENDETLERFERFVEEVLRQSGSDKVQVVAHSLGGLIAFALACERPELFDHLYLAGSPLRGGVGFLPDLTAGSAAGLNRRILGPEVLASFPSVYTFFPLDGQGLVDRVGNALPTDFYSAEAWEKNRWGLFASPSADSSARASFLKTALQRARRFRERLTPRKRLPPLTVISSDAYPTIGEVIQDGSGGANDLDFESGSRCAGDGRVCAAHAVPPPGVRFDRIRSSKEHALLLDDPVVIEAIRSRVRP